MKAKTKFTRLWSILLALAMVVGMLPIAALAAGPATATADFTNETKAAAALALLNAAKTPGAEDSTWDSDTKTLTLGGVNFTTTASTALQLPDGATIVLNGENTITGGDSGSSACFGIYAWGDLTIQGTGTLNVTGGTETSKYSKGIQADYYLTITGGTVTATGKAATAGSSHGIFARDGVDISGGTVTATGGTAHTNGTSGYFSYGICANDGDVSISGGAVIAKANDFPLKANSVTLPTAYWWRTSPSDSYTPRENAAIGSVRTHLEIWNWDPKASADFEDDVEKAQALLKAVKTGRAADSTWDPDSKTLTLNGVHFVTSAATAVKLPAGATIVLNGTNTITSTYSGSDSEDSYGIYVYDGSLTIQDGSEEGTGTLNVTGGNATGEYSYGIYAYENVEISGGTVTATGGAAGYDSHGICADTNVEISGGTVTATGGTANDEDGESYGIYAYKNVEISDGTVTATGGTANGEYGESYGIYAYEDMEISGGAVIAEAGSVGDGGTAAALNEQPTLPITGYSWRLSDSEGYHDPAYTWADEHTYVEIKSNPTITFNANGGKVNDKNTDTAITNAAGKLTSLPEPDRSGYTFKEWNTEPDGTGTKVTVETTFTENTTVYAQWEVEAVTITSVAITGIDAPKSNKALDTEADCNTTGVSNAKPTVTWDSSDSKAGYGKIYTASITLTASEGYVFSDSTTVTVNGNPATSVTKNANGTFTVTYTFPATDKHNIEITVDTDVRDGDAAKNPTISSGYEIEICFFIEDTNKNGDFTDDKTLILDKTLVEEYIIAHPEIDMTFEEFIAALKDEGLDDVKTEFTGGYDYSFIAMVKHNEEIYFDKDADEKVTDAIVKVNGKDITDECDGGSSLIVNPGAYVFSAAKTYTVSFDANGGTGTMADVTGISGEYTLPANSFTAPEGKQFKCWSVDGKEKAVGDKITVTADTTVKAVWETLPAAPADYDILNGANSKWTQDSDGNISVRGSGEFSKFVGVKVDGKTVDEKYYTVKEGSTIVTLKPEYLNTLTAGKHTLEIVWTDGTADTTFTVDAKPANTDTKSPQTGDSSSIALWIALLFVSAAGVLSTAVLGKKKKRSARISEGA